MTCIIKRSQWHQFHHWSRWWQSISKTAVRNRSAGEQGSRRRRQLCPFQFFKILKIGFIQDVCKRVRAAQKVRLFMSIIIYFTTIIMCQGLGCGNCLYYNHCHSCIGMSLGLLCCSCWLCVPQALEHLRSPGCCKCECNQGCGYTCLCYGNYCCTPTYLRDYAVWKTIGNIRGLIYDLFISSQAIVQRDLGAPESNRRLQ